MNVVVGTLASAGLILLNGVFVAAEFAIVGASRAAMERLASKGDDRARKVLAVLESARLQDAYIATSQLGITVASLALGMVGEHALANGLTGILEEFGVTSIALVHLLASTIAVATLGFFHIVIGEMVPKTLALANVDRAALILSPLVLGLRMPLYPLVWALNIVGGLTLRIFGIRRQTSDSDRSYTPEELRYVFRESQEGGQLRSESGKILLRLFEFGNLMAGDVMVPRVRVRGVPLGLASQQLAAELRGSTHTRYPVYDGNLDRIVGMIHVKEALRRVQRGKPVLRQHARGVPFVPTTATLDVVMDIMGRWRTQMAVVMDEQGGTAGIITIEDVFEEIIGKIDELATERLDAEKDEQGRVRAGGTARLSQVNELLTLPLSHETVTTVGGLVLHLLGRPARVGDVLRHGRCIIEVRAVAGNGVKECLISEDKTTAKKQRTKA